MVKRKGRGRGSKDSGRVPRKGQHRNVANIRTVERREGIVEDVFRAVSPYVPMLASCGMNPYLPAMYARVEGHQYGSRFAEFTVEYFCVLDSLLAKPNDVERLAYRVDAFLTDPPGAAIQRVWKVWARRTSNAHTKAYIDDYYLLDGWVTSIDGIGLALADFPPTVVADQVSVLAQGLLLVDRTRRTGRRKGERDAAGRLEQAVEAYRRLVKQFGDPSISLSQLLRKLGMSKSTFYRYGLSLPDIRTRALATPRT